MATNDNINMLVCWSNQRRPIKININDDLNIIEKTISTYYQLQQVNELHEYQIQYYDEDYQKFVDLYPNTFDRFRQLLQKLSSSEAPPKSTKQWIIKIIPKTIQPIRRTIRGSINDDTYNYQQDNDPTELHEIDESLPTIINVQSSSLPDESKNSISQNIDEDEQEVAQSDPQSSQLNTIHPPILITHDHPCGLNFGTRLADHQRQQYEKDMTRASSSRSTVGGVLLRAYPEQDNASSNTKSYPIVHFRIPKEIQHLEWFIFLYILTEADVNAIHYLHPSKGIHLHGTIRDSRCGPIRNSTESVNPYAVRLTPAQVQEERFEIWIKVCNMTDISSRRKEHLREFSRSANSKNYQDLTSLSTNTMLSLNFTNEKYHLGCLLTCGDIIHDHCISNVTEAVSSVKRNDKSARKFQDTNGKKKLKGN